MFREDRTPSLQPIVQLQHESISIQDLSVIALKCAGAYVEIFSSKTDQLEIELWDVQDTPKDEFFAALRDGDRLELEQGLDRGVLDAKRHRQTRLSVALPKAFAGELAIRSNTGAVQFEERFTFSRLCVECAQGGVFAPVGVVADELSIQTASGGQYLGEISGKHVALSSAAGNIEIEYVECDTLDASDAAGCVKVKKARTGAMSINTASGAVDIGDACASGRVEITTASGELVLSELRAADLAITSASGSICAERLSGAGKLGSDVGNVSVTRFEPKGDLRVHSTMGKVCVGVVPDADVAVELESMMGRMDTDLPGAVRRSGSVSGGAEGAPTVYVKTMGGNISVHRA